MWGPYVFRPKNGKKRLILILKDKISGKRTSVSYPKFLVEQHIGRYLTNEETVDHIDENPLNNDLDNLRILTRSENSKIAAKRIKDITVNCVFCKKKFIIKGNKISQRQRGKAGPFCSRKCSGKYGAEVQNKRQKRVKSQTYQKVYYKEPFSSNTKSGQQNIGETLTCNDDGNTEA